MSAQTYFTLRAGRFGNWRLGDGGDNLWESPYYTRHDDSPLFNRLFVAVYDLLLSKMTNMGYLIPTPSRTLKEIFQEKIHGTDSYLVSAELIAYIKWLVYLAPFKDRSSVDHAEFFNKQVALLNHEDNQHWRRFLYKELDAWYTDFKPTKKRRGRSVGRTSTVVDVDPDEIFIGSNLDGFDDDPWKDDAPPPGSGAAFGALAAAAAHAAAGGGG